jgi:hypothetical protein
MSPGGNRTATRFFPADGGNGRPNATDVSPGMAPPDRRPSRSVQRATSGSAADRRASPASHASPAGDEDEIVAPGGRSTGVQGEVTNALRNFNGLQSAATFCKNIADLCASGMSAAAHPIGRRDLVIQILNGTHSRGD